MLKDRGRGKCVDDDGRRRSRLMLCTNRSKFKRARVSLTLRLICGYLSRSLRPFLTCIYGTLLDLEIYKIRVSSGIGFNGMQLCSAPPPPHPTPPRHFEHRGSARCDWPTVTSGLWSLPRGRWWWVGHSGMTIATGANTCCRAELCDGGRQGLGRAHVAESWDIGHW